ncbi:CPBP family intramembrane glutamic endopeptidase [Clostridium nigeriense]|uniref:CPBP family intramembrane glutamic endopeptidase n=1 Tax=Clostridium nigeriense TaxID=1805470 RepID=UPI003D33889D
MKEKFKAFFASIGYLLLTVLIQLAVSIVGGIAIGFYYVINGVIQMENGLTLEYEMDSTINSILSLTNIFLLISSVITILALILIYKIKRRNYKEELQIVKANRFNIFFAIILGISCWLFNSGVLSLVEEAGFFSSQFEYMNDILAPISQGSILISMLTVGIVAPIAEEFLFRGVIYNTLKKKISIKWTIIIQAILFGVFHGNLVQGTYATLLGLVFGYVTYKTKSLWPAIIMHMVNNLTANIASFMLGDYIGGTLLYIIFTVVGTIGMALLILLIRKSNINNEEKIMNFEDFNNLN